MERDTIIKFLEYLLRKTSIRNFNVNESDIEKGWVRIGMALPTESFHCLFMLMECVLNRDQQIAFIRTYSEYLKWSEKTYLTLSENQILNGSFVEIADLIAANCAIAAYDLSDFKKMIQEI